jgi:hypothetical protein
MRTLVNGDLVRKREAATDAAGGERMPLIQAQQARTRRLAFDDHGYVAKMFAESGRDAAESTLNEIIEFIFGKHAYVH